MKNFMAIARKVNIPGFGLLQVGSDLSWIEGISGGSSSPPTAANLTSQIDGTRTVFAIGGTPTSAALTEVVYNGQVLTPTTDYTVAGSNLTLGFVAQIGDYLYVRYW